MLSAPTKKLLYFNTYYNNEPIMTRSTLAAGKVQDTFAGEAREVEGGEDEKTGGYFPAKFPQDTISKFPQDMTSSLRYFFLYFLEIVLASYRNYGIK